MRFGWLAAAAALVCAGQAEAATFVQYEAIINGSYTDTFNFPSKSIAGQYLYRFIIEVDPGYVDNPTFSAGTGTTFSYNNLSLIASASITPSGTLTYSDRFGSYGGAPIEGSNASITFDNSASNGSFPKTLALSPASGTVDVFFSGRTSGYDIRGSVQSVQALGTVAGFGLATITPVPEPATWAMMIVGFGAIGGLMRHRSRPRKIAFS